MDSAPIKLEQRRFLRGRQTLTLHGDMLKVEYRRGLSLNEYRFGLRGFDPDPTRVKRVPQIRIVAASLMTLVGCTHVLNWTGGKLMGVPSSVLMGIGFLILAALIWSLVAKEAYDVILFRGPGGQFVLWPDHRDKQELNEFVTILSTRIREAQHWAQDLVKQLRQAEIIHDWEYEQAMDLLKQNDEPTEDPQPES